MSECNYVGCGELIMGKTFLMSEWMNEWKTDIYEWMSEWNDIGCGE